MPRPAASSRPGFAWVAPVKAPFSWPKSSLSSRFSESAAQLMQTNGPAARGEWRWIQLGQHLLADARLAQDEHVDEPRRRPPRGRALGQLIELAHRLGRHDGVVVGRGPARGRPRRAVAAP